MLIANKGTMLFAMSIMPKLLSPPARAPLLAAVALFTFINNSLHAEDVIVTGCIGAVLNTCQPSCPADLGTMGLHSSSSTAVPAGAARSKTLYGTANNCHLVGHTH